MAEESAVAVLVLAGGEGRRIGGAKPQRRVGAASLLQRAATLAQGYGAPVAVSVRHPGQIDAACNLERVLDPEGAAGPLAGLASGLNWARRRGSSLLLTLPCDAPFLPQDLAQRLRERIAQTGCAVAVPRSLGQSHYACSLWRTDLAPRLAEYASAGGRSLRGFAEFVGGETVDWGEAGPDPFFNINTPQDLNSAAALARQLHLE